MAYGILQNKEDAEDAVQDALVSSYVHLRSFKGRSALKTWFTRIVINAALMIRRKRKPAEMDSEPEWAIHASSHWMEVIPSREPDPETSCGKSETLRVIEELIAQLRPTLRQALTLSWFEEIPVGQAPALLGVSTATFKARLFRARRQLISQARRSLTCRSLRTTPHPSSNKVILAATMPAQTGFAETRLR
jgi:RNA polymerase sigma-70 factor (ECF subfamily)